MSETYDPKEKGIMRTRVTVFPKPKPGEGQVDIQQYSVQSTIDRVDRNYRVHIDVPELRHPDLKPVDIVITQMSSNYHIREMHEQEKTVYDIQVDLPEGVQLRAADIEVNNQSLREMIDEVSRNRIPTTGTDPGSGVIKGAIHILLATLPGSSGTDPNL